MALLDTLNQKLAEETIAEKATGLAAAIAEAKWKCEYGKAVTRLRAECKSIAEAEYRATVECDELLMERLVTAAKHESQKEMLRTLRTQSENERTIRADVRAADIASARG